MAERNVTLRAHSCKEKRTKKGSRKRRKTHHHENQTSPTPLLQRGNNDEWLISKELLETLPPTHNHFIGLLRNDTLNNVKAGIETLTALLSLECESSILPANPYYGAYWLALNLMEALQFEIDHRHQLVATPSGTSSTSL